ncbi:MAG: hypothetical protein JWP89_2721 [Schlesneria sp.]|nr:hypothetical protein [Schlesneria sp.]
MSNPAIEIPSYIAVFGGLWAGVSAFATCTGMVNASRNAVITGELPDGIKLSSRARWLIFWSDWFSWVTVTIGTLFIAGFTLRSLTTKELATTEWVQLCSLLGTLHIITGIWVAFFMWFEARVMVTEIRAAYEWEKPKHFAALWLLELLDDTLNGLSALQAAILVALSILGTFLGMYCGQSISRENSWNVPLCAAIFGLLGLITAAVLFFGLRWLIVHKPLAGR